jgi:hypothetical protein
MEFEHLRGWPRFARQWHACWAYVIDVALTIWVLRAPVGGLLVGFLILWFTPQAQDLFVDLATGSIGFAATFFAILFFVWAMPTEYAANILISTDERYLPPDHNGDASAFNDANLPLHDDGQHKFRRWLKKWTPPTLGALVFVCVLGAMLRSLSNLPTLADADYIFNAKRKLVLSAIELVAMLIVFCCYVRYREKIADLGIFKWAEQAAEVTLRPLRRWLPPIFALRRIDPHHIKSGDLGLFLLIGMFIMFAALPTIFSFRFATWFPRAAAVPFVIGGWMPLLAVLSGLGRRLRAPLIFIGFTLKTILPLTISPNYEVRTLNAADTIVKLTGNSPAVLGPPQSISLNDAVKWWQRANHCEDDSKSCPRPVIVAGAGGASRAGFFTAGVIGQMLDDQFNLVTARDDHGLSPVELQNRIFAFSTVSGSSVAAIMTVAALAASQNGEQPCREDRDGLWHGDKIESWRSCLEALLSGDFLTPVFTGLVYHDAIRFLRLADRGALLERAWEEHFRKTIAMEPTAGNGFDCIGSLECPFMALRPSRERWLPLLVLNGTSVGTGQRIVTTALAVTYRADAALPCPANPRSRECQLFAKTFSLHDLLAERRSGARGDAINQALDDISLSTAAHNSARFPLVSPPGEIRNSDGDVVDRLVDGGYFENFGAQTATELAEAITIVNPDLRPFILVLSNDPEVPEQEGAARSRMEQARRSSDGTFVTDITAPLKAFAHTRNARGTLAVDAARATLDRLNRSSCNVARIRVWGEPAGELATRDVSVSWWLSKPVQRYLHEQTEFDRTGRPVNRQSQNKADIEVLLDAVRGDPSNEAFQSCPK